MFRGATRPLPAIARILSAVKHAFTCSVKCGAGIDENDIVTLTSIFVRLQCLPMWTCQIEVVLGKHRSGREARGKSASNLETHVYPSSFGGRPNRSVTTAARPVKRERRDRHFDE
jgi:hypothetical protein